MATPLEENPTPLLQDVIRPISESNPVGDDISYDDDFLQVKDMVDQLSSVDPGGVDYGSIVEKSRALLGQKAKDLRVSTYLGMALLQTDGFQGLLEGLTAQKMLCEAFWENLYPPVRRMRARQAALQYMAERLAAGLEGTDPTVEDREALEQAIEVMKALQAFTMEAMKDDAPLLSGLRKAIEDALRRAPKPAPPPEPAEEGAAAGEEGAPAAQLAAPAALGEPQSESDAFSVILKGIDFLQEQNPAGAVPYRVSRSLFWDAMVAELPNQQGATFFEGPAEHVRTYLNTLAQSRDWATLLSIAEGQFREYPVWLDLQRFVASAMEGLGPDYKHAREAVLYETALLVKRVPGLPRLSFSEGTPFADPATRFWLEQTVEPVLASGGGESAGAASSDGEALSGQYREAQKRFGDGDLAGALSVLQEGTLQDGSPRSRFRRRLYLAVLCMQGNQPAIARPLLEDLAAEVEKFSLHAWEPALALEVWSNLYRCYDLLLTGEVVAEELVERAQRVFEKICQVDVTQALKARGA